jgi:hypothetical protein
MNNNGTTPNDILNWIKEKEGGKYDNYNKCKEDTEEAIEVFDGLYGKTFATPYKLFEYLYSELKMRVSNEHQSFYRAFLVINKDEIISIRLAQHYSTKNSTRKGFRDNGKPDVEYHLLIDCHQPITPQNDIYFDRIFSNVSMKIRDFDLSDFNDGHIRRKILDEIIRLLTYGTATNENKQYNKNRNMKQTIKLRESELKRMIAESVKRVLREHSRDIDDDNYFGGGLPDRYFDDDAPDDDRISQKQIAQLDNIADVIADIANNTSDEAELLFQAADNISEFTSRYK